MLKFINLKSDIKQLWRDTIMAMLFLAPILIMVLFRLIISLLLPYVSTMVDSNIMQYEQYILSLVLFISPAMLGMVMGFMLIQDKDNKIVELMSITPLGRNVYLLMRMIFVFFFSFIYTLYGYFVIGLYLIPFITVLYIAILLSMYGAILGLLLFRVATDKVKGLTYAKGLNILMIFAFAHLADTQWITIFSAFFPSFWVTEIIMKPNDLFTLVMAAVVHLIWFGACIIGLNSAKKRTA